MKGDDIMLDGNIYYDKVVMFKSDVPNAIKAALKIEDNTYVHVKTYETFILVMIDTDVEKPEYGRSFNTTIKKITDILDSFNIEYKCKQLKF